MSERARFHAAAYSAGPMLDSYRALVRETTACGPGVGEKQSVQNQGTT
jgi:hypothetical protein